MEKHTFPYSKIVFVCTNQRAPGERKCCANGGGAALRAKLKALVKARGLASQVRVSQSGCLNRCESGPNIMVFPDNAWYSGVGETDLDLLIDALAAGLDTQE